MVYLKKKKNTTQRKILLFIKVEENGFYRKKVLSVNINILIFVSWQ